MWMMPFNPYVVLLIVVAGFDSVLSTSQYFSTYKPSGLQSGPDITGSTFAAAATYSAHDNSVIITGSSWGRFFESREQIMDESYDKYGRQIEKPTIVQGCFLATAILPGVGNDFLYKSSGNDNQNKMFWSHRQRVRLPSANEACNAVHLFEKSESAIIAAHSEERRNVTISGGVIAEQIKQFGMLVDMNWNVDGDKSFTAIGGQMLKDPTVIFPVAMTSNSQTEGGGLFVLFMEAASSNGGKHINILEGQQGHDPSAYFDYGAGFGFSLARFDFVEKQETSKTSIHQIQQTWLKAYNTTKINGEVFVNGVVMLSSGTIVVAGTTNGQGSAFGAETDQGPDMDGFVVKISPNKGELVTEGITPSGPSSYRIQSTYRKHLNDWVSGICHHPGDQYSVSFVYIVGATEGILPGSPDARGMKGTSAFIMKFDVRKMVPVWTRQVGAIQPVAHKKIVARGMACAVTPDGASVWLGGVVEDGGLLQGVKKSFGGMDIFVAKLSTNDGNITMVQQMGSSKDDQLARQGGLLTDIDGNAILTGNTYGSFYRTRSPTETTSDVFVVTVALFDGQPTVPVAAATAASTTSNTNAKSSSNSSHTGTIMLCLSLVAVVSLSALYLSRRVKKDRAVTDRSQVTTYLNNFNIEDVELKHSFTGGWHCNFVNDLADGKFVPRMFTQPVLTVRTKNRELQRTDALYTRAPLDTDVDGIMFPDADNDDSMDGSNRSTIGLLHGGEAGSVYGNLVEAYNNTWESTTARKQSHTSENKLGFGGGNEII